jgi:hypothetical protein
MSSTDAIGREETASVTKEVKSQAQPVAALEDSWRPRKDERLWCGFRDCRCECVEPNGDVILRRTRRQGFIRFRYSAMEVAALVRCGQLRPYS